MRFRPLVSPALLTLAALLLFPAAAKADPALVVTGGTASHRNPVLEVFPGYSFNFSGSGFGAVGVGEKLGNGPLSMSCLFCAAGQTFDGAFSITRFTILPNSSASVNGVSIQWLEGSSFSFDLAPVVLPSAPGDGFAVTTPFTFSGTLTGFAVPVAAPPPFSYALTGQGIATLTFGLRFGPSGPGYALIDARYDFTAPAAVPEPTTLALLGAGLGSLALRARRRRAARRT
ncbi:MAG TPA: PEP-CTERM sorting domain-containing protein [Pyrinomonadaceae bacterium]|nr:PEP-CTERM sorting domain-containing protein [Pyrinomonadaceae bacterium]